MQIEPPPHDYLARQVALGNRLAARDISLFVVTKPSNIFYLTGFRGSAGVVVFGLESSILLVDPRYTVQAREQVCGVEVREVKVRLYQAAATWLRKRHAKRVGFEDAHLSVSEFDRMRKDGPPGVHWAPLSGLIEDFRAVKAEPEIAQIRKACQLTAAAFTETLPLVRPGAIERDLAIELDFRMRRMGAEGVAFETIVASGPRGALPHARPSAKALKPSEFVIFDLGAILGGYAADMTRTVYLGAPGRRVRSLYESLLHAQEDALAALRGDVRAGDVDAAARRRLTEAGLERHFTHSTGHGVGIEIHERPRIGKGEKTSVPAGSVVTVEPGIYLEGFGGIRIEDTVRVGPDGVEILTLAAKNCWFLG
ncbi:MAG: M24 family metallopeptidase [Terriglobia bacterium]